MRLNEDVCLTTYFNDFDCKISYSLKENDPITLREAHKMVVNIKKKIKAFGKVGRMDDPKLFNPRNKKEGKKPTASKKPKEDMMGKS